MIGGITKSVLFGFLAFVLLKVFNFAEVFPQIYSILKVLPSYLIIPIFATLGVVNFEKEGIKGLNSLRFTMFLSLLGAVQLSLGFGFGFFFREIFSVVIALQNFRIRTFSGICRWTFHCCRCGGNFPTIWGGILAGRPRCYHSLCHNRAFGRNFFRTVPGHRKGWVRLFQKK